MLYDIDYIHNYIESEVGSPPAFDLEEFLNNQSWKKEGKGELQLRDINNLKDGQRYLESINRGIEIAKRARENGKVSGDLKDFERYQALELSLHPYLRENNLEFPDIISTSMKVIEILLNNDNSELPYDEDVKIARQLFLSILQETTVTSETDFWYF